MRYEATPALWRYLAENKRSIAWLARRVHCSRQLLSYLRTGERTISEPLARAIALVCGDAPLEEFFAPLPPTYVFDPSLLVDEREAATA